MKDNYPLLSQSEERMAPWNQKDPAPTQVDCCVSYCLSKSMPVTISNYDLIDDEPNFDNTNFIEEFENDNPHSYSQSYSSKGIKSLQKHFQSH